VEQLTVRQGAAMSKTDIGNSQYWANKLNKIQFALDILRSVKAGRNLERLIAQLEEQESLASQDLVEAEQCDEEI
jgi:hypothetical protein